MTGRGMTPTCPPAQQSRLPTGHQRRTVGNRAAEQDQCRHSAERRGDRGACSGGNAPPPGAGASTGTVVATGLTALTAVETSLRLLIGIATLRRPVMPHTGRVPSSNALRRCLTSSQRPPTRYGRPVFEHPVPPSSTPRSPDSPEESVGKGVDGQREHLLLRQLHVTAMIVSAAAQEDASGATSRLESSARADSGQSRGGFSEQTHGRAGCFEVVGGCGDRCCARPDDSDYHRHAVGLD